MVSIDPVRKIVDEDFGTPEEVAANDKAGSTTGADEPELTGGGLTSKADSISTAQLAKQVGDSGETTAPTESAYEQLANQQADQYLAMTKSMDPLTSGYAIPSIDKNISSGAEAMLGQSSSSPISQWLNQQTAAAQAQYAPTEAANSQVAQAENSGEALVAKGLQGLGIAETEMMQSAPYDQLLNSLASEVPYHLAEGYSIPGLTAANTPSWLQQAEENVGVTPLAASKGSNASAQGLLPAPSTGTITSPSLTSADTGGAPQN